MAGLPVYRGAFDAAATERLLWRAGFGPRPGEAAELAKAGLDGAVARLTKPPKLQLAGPEPHDDDGLPIAPYDAWSHDHLWWLDRLAAAPGRSSRSPRPRPRSCRGSRRPCARPRATGCGARSRGTASSAWRQSSGRPTTREAASRGRSSR